MLKDAAFGDWLFALADSDDALALDGKALRGAGRADGAQVYLLSAFLDDQAATVAQVCRIERTVTELKSGKQRIETVFAVTSLPPAPADPQRLLQRNRGHWGGNRSHYMRDATFAEDRSRIRKAHGPAVMAGLRNVAIALARLLGFTNIASALRDFAHSPRRTLAALGI